MPFVAAVAGSGNRAAAGYGKCPIPDSRGTELGPWGTVALMAKGAGIYMLERGYTVYPGCFRMKPLLALRKRESAL
jgi:hypothetical protein